MGRFIKLTGIIDGQKVKLAIQHRDLKKKWKIGNKLTKDDWYGTCWAIAVSEVIRSLLSLSFAMLGITFGPFSLDPPDVLWYIGELSQLLASIIENAIALFLMVGLIFRSREMLRTWVWIRLLTMLLLLSPLVTLLVSLSAASILAVFPFIVIVLPIFVLVEAGRIYSLLIVRK